MCKSTFSSTFNTNIKVLVCHLYSASAKHREILFFPIGSLLGDFKGQSFTKDKEPILFSSSKTKHPLTLIADTFSSKLTTPLMLTAQHPHPSLHPAMGCPSPAQRWTGRTHALCYSEHSERRTPSTQRHLWWPQWFFCPTLLPTQLPAVRPH